MSGAPAVTSGGAAGTRDAYVDARVLARILAQQKQTDALLTQPAGRRVNEQAA